MKNFSFSKKIRLLDTDSFSKVFKNPVKFKTFAMITLSISNNLNYPRLGLIVSKKVSRYAYQRNKIKRSIRESFRLIQHYLINFDFVIIVRPSILKLKKKILQNTLKNLWTRYYQ